MVRIALSQPTDEISLKELNRAITRSRLGSRDFRREVECALFPASFGDFDEPVELRLVCDQPLYILGVVFPITILVEVHLHATPSEVSIDQISKYLTALLFERLCGSLARAVRRHSTFGKPLPSWYIGDLRLSSGRPLVSSAALVRALLMPQV